LTQGGLKHPVVRAFEWSQADIFDPHPGKAIATETKEGRRLAGHIDLSIAA